MESGRFQQRGRHESLARHEDRHTQIGEVVARVKHHLAEAERHLSIDLREAGRQLSSATRLVEAYESLIRKQ